MNELISRLNFSKLKSRKTWINKYTIALVCFLVWVLIFDKYNFATHRNLTNTVEKLELEQVSYVEKIKETRKQLKNIDLHKEKYARERYYMHKPNEEIIVINQEE